jgi:hypothetical protein
MTLYRFYVDQRMFALTKATLLQYPLSLLTRLIQNDCNDPRVIIDGTNVYVDADPESFARIVDVYRGYTGQFQAKVDDDMKYFLNVNPPDDVATILETCSDTEEDIDTIVTNAFGFTQEELADDEEQVNTHNSNRDKENILATLRHRLEQEDPVDVIQCYSNHPAIKDLLKKTIDTQMDDSDGSLDLNSD